MDLDCFGSMALLKYLHPDFRLVRSQTIHPIARNLYNLYQNQFPFISPKDLKDQEIEHIIVVDTRSQNRVQEVFKWIEDYQGKIDIYDHHSEAADPIENATVHFGDYGANTTLIGLELMKRGIEIAPEDATIALAAIFSDTGSFRFEHVTSEDFQVAAYLVQNKAAVKLVDKFLQSLKEEHQRTLFHDVLNRLTYKDINGHFVILSYIEIEDQVGGLAAVIEKIFEVEHSEAIFSVFYFKKRNDSLIVARSSKKNIDVDKVLHELGGGGHPSAASALIKDKSGVMVFATLEEHLKTALLPAVTAADIMITKVNVIRDTMSLLDASKLLEDMNHSGAPVLSERGELVGFMTLFDIMKGRKQNQMSAPVKAFMSKEVIAAKKDDTIREVENKIFRNDIGHLPVVHGKSLLGMITRTDYLAFIGR